eukprot:scaffold10092_cov96-Isochrysis_galbana.AAC.1
MHAYMHACVHAYMRTCARCVRARVHAHCAERPFQRAVRYRVLVEWGLNRVPSRAHLFAASSPSTPSINISACAIGKASVAAKKPAKSGSAIASRYQPYLDRSK